MPSALEPRPGIGVTDSTDPNPNRPVLRFSAEQWRAFTETIKIKH